jgi:hypothetical protein
MLYDTRDGDDSHVALTLYAGPVYKKLSLLLNSIQLKPTTTVQRKNPSMTLLDDATTAYLSPLLQKHAAGKLITWEDLQSSHEAAVAVLSKQPSNPFVSVS